MTMIVKEIVFRRINSSFEPVLHLEGTVEKVGDTFHEETQPHAGHCKYRLTVYTALDDKVNEEMIDYYSFGVTVEHGKPGHGGEWSSNSGQINRKFGKNIMECTVQENGHNWAMAVDVDTIKPWLPDILEFIPAGEGDGFNEFNRIMPKDGVTLPRGKGYFQSTTVNRAGELVGEYDDPISVHVCY